MRGGRCLITAVIIVCFSVSISRAVPQGQINLAFEWKLQDGRADKKDFGPVELSEIAGRGFWVAFQKEKEQTFGGICFDGSMVLCHTPAEQMNSLELVITYKSQQQTVTRRAVLFDKDRPMGTRSASVEDVYHILVLNDFVTDKDLSLLPAEADIAGPERKGAFGRTYSLARSYAVQSDEKSKRYSEITGVKAVYRLPRFILAAEQWLEIQKEAEKKKKSGGGLFGGALDDVADEIAGEAKPEPTKISVYSVDVLLDEVEAEGRYAVGFQSARSIWNDILEGKVIYEATGAKRRIITASIVFSQMQKNRIQRNSDNRIISVDSTNLNVLESCEGLWPGAKKSISDFVAAHPGWKVITTQKPVTFYKNDEPVYAMYAWFKVDPATGRMTGVLADGSHGAVSDELAQLEQTLLEKTKEKIGARGGPVKVLFSQVAGMYVASAGILDGISLTICDPNLANLGDKEWRQFLAEHSLDFCQQFLEDNAGMYDSYETRLGFWQGATLIISELGGKEAARKCAERALEDAKNKAIDDAKGYLEDKYKKAKEEIVGHGSEAVDEAMEKYAPEVKKFVDAVEKVEECYDKGVETKETLEDYRDRAKAVLDEVKQKYEELTTEE